MEVSDMLVQGIKVQASGQWHQPAWCLFLHVVVISLIDHNE